MPEGHVSHRNAQRLRAALAGRELVRVEAPEPRLALQRIPERLAGDRVAGAEAVGKHHLLRLESGRVLHSHLMMSGAWRVLPAAQAPRRGGLFLALWTRDSVAALYRCPRVRLLEPGEPLPADLRATGPDLLDPAVDPAAAAAAALGRLEPTRQVGEALMDQRVLAGIGNVYKSEACFMAGVDPWRPVGTLSAEEAAALGATAARLLADGVRDRGAIRTYRPPGAPAWGRERTWVYGRRGRPCRRCGTPVRARGQGDANRTTYSSSARRRSRRAAPIAWICSFTSAPNRSTRQVR
jgi:endonuclease-8